MNMSLQKMDEIHKLLDIKARRKCNVTHILESPCMELGWLAGYSD